jgi:ABC-2 type transport system permease protein
VTLWRLEWLRLVRTHRLLVLIGTYVFFGLTGPLTARYLSTILGRLGTEGVRVEFPEPKPADGIAQFVGNASQIGLLVVVLVAASALAFDARREMAVFLRTRVSGVRDIVIPGYLTTVAAAVAALVAGSLAAWYETTVLLGSVSAAAVLTGIGLGSLFLAFAIALTALAASLLRGVAASAGVTLACLLLLALVGGLTPLGRWLPTRLAGALTELAQGGSAADYTWAVATTLVATAAALVLTVTLNARREI